MGCGGEAVCEWEGVCFRTPSHIQGVVHMGIMAFPVPCVKKLVGGSPFPKAKSASGCAVSQSRIFWVCVCVAALPDWFHRAFRTVLPCCVLAESSTAIWKRALFFFTFLSLLLKKSIPSQDRPFLKRFFSPGTPSGTPHLNSNRVYFPGMAGCMHAKMKGVSGFVVVAGLGGAYI